MHLVYRAIEKEPVPSILPANLIPPTKRTGGLDRVLPGESGLSSCEIYSFVFLLVLDYF